MRSNAEWSEWQSGPRSYTPGGKHSVQIKAIKPGAVREEKATERGRWCDTDGYKGGRTLHRLVDQLISPWQTVTAPNMDPFLWTLPPLQSWSDRMINVGSSHAEISDYYYTKHYYNFLLQSQKKDPTV